MRTDRFRHRAIYLLCLLTVFCLLTACGPKDGGTTEPSPAKQTASASATGSPVSLASDTTEMVTAHFPTFELAVPADWSVRGNVGKLYEGDGMFLLAGTLDGPADTASVEAVLAEELELIFNTEYYRSQVRFDVEKEYGDGAMHRLSGTLYNDRTGGTLRFAGTFGTSPGLYGFYFWSDVSGDRAGDRLMEASYESIRIL